MDKKIKDLVWLFVFLTMAGITGFGQGEKPIEMADTMRSNGKIYVVVAVIVTIFLGLAAYIFALDKKITKLERESE